MSWKVIEKSVSGGGGRTAGEPRITVSHKLLLLSAAAARALGGARRIIVLRDGSRWRVAPCGERERGARSLCGKKSGDGGAFACKDLADAMADVKTVPVEVVDGGIEFDLGVSA